MFSQLEMGEGAKRTERDKKKKKSGQAEITKTEPRLKLTRS